MTKVLRLLKVVALALVVGAVLVGVALIPWAPLGTLFMLAASAALIPSPLAYHWRSGGKWRKHPLGWHLMAYMGVFSAVMVLSVAASAARGFAVPASNLPDFVRPLVWECVSIVAWWRLVIILRTPRPTD